VVHSAFNGRRIVIFSGGTKTDDVTILDEVRAIRDGGGFGSIIGRNSFQRDRQSVLKLLDQIIRIYRGEIP
jgi:class I fructose-bisphosphate aldolase